MHGALPACTSLIACDEQETLYRETPLQVSALVGSLVCYQQHASRGLLLEDRGLVGHRAHEAAADMHLLQDRSFTFILKTPPASVLLQKAAGVAKGSGTPNSAKVGQVSRAQLKVSSLPCAEKCVCPVAAP